MTDLVSVLIPSYNSLLFLKTCSLPSVLGQTFQNFEILIANEGEDEGVRKFIDSLEDPRIKYHECKERTYTSTYNRWCTGGAFGVNMLLDLAEGDYIAHLDQDDIWFPDALEKRIKALEEFDVDFVYGKAFRSLSRQWFGSVFKGEKGVNTLHHFTVLYRKHLKEVRYLETGVSPVDYERWMTMHHTGKYRMHFLDSGIGIYNEGKSPDKTPLPELHMLYEHFVGSHLKEFL